MGNSNPTQPQEFDPYAKPPSIGSKISSFFSKISDAVSDSVRSDIDYDIKNEDELKDSTPPILSAEDRDTFLSEFKTNINPHFAHAEDSKITADSLLELHDYVCKYRINDNGSVTFWPTPNLKQCTKKLSTSSMSMDYLLKLQDCSRSYVCSNPDSRVILPDPNSRSTTTSFLISALIAWSQHYPFRLRPEHVWLVILQSVALHVDANAEKLRDEYVKHQGKMRLEVDVPPTPTYEEWSDAVHNFNNLMSDYMTQDTNELFDCDFSTSTMVERLATKVTLMDICKNYFEYVCQTMCGFPKVTLDGNKQDWMHLKNKTSKLLDEKVIPKFGNDWANALLPLLDRFIGAFDGEIDCLFWNSMIKRCATYGSGAGSYYSGWINILFPFLDKQWNYYCVPYSMDHGYVKQGLQANRIAQDGPDISYFPNGVGSAPVLWERDGDKIDLKFISGFCGYIQDPKTLELTPNVAWCVAECNKKK